MTSWRSGAGSLGLQEEIVANQSGSGTGERYLQVGEAFTALILRDVLPEGLPVPSTVLILSDPGAGRELLTLELLLTRLRAGNKVLWISLENFPSALKAMSEFAGVEKTIHERPDSLEFLDCYSSQVGVKSTERYSADASNLPNLSVATSLAISKLSRDAHLVVMLDSLSSLVQMAGARAAIEFFRTLVGKVRSVRGDLVTTLNRKAFSPTILASVQEMVDVVLELRMTEDQADVHRYLRVRKMLGRKYDSVSVSYDIDQEHGVFRRTESNFVGLVSGPTIDVNGHDRAEDVCSTTLSDSTSLAAPLWREAQTLGREKNEIGQNSKLDIISDRKIEKHGLDSEELAHTPTPRDSLSGLLLAKDKPYLSKKDTISRVLPSAELSPLTELTGVEEAMLEAIDNGLLALGEVVRDTIYDRFDRMYQLRREEIPRKLHTFHEALQTMFGAGAKVIETQIAKSLDRRLNVSFTENESWTIVDYFDLAKRTRA